METIGTILQLVKPGVFMSKLNIKEDYYSAPIYEPDQKYLKFQFDRFLCIYTALPNGYTEGPRNFKKEEKSSKFLKKVLKLRLSELRRVEKTVIAGYFDDLITINSSYVSLP